MGVDGAELLPAGVFLEQVVLVGIDIIASVRRLGLITFRLAMILSALRLGLLNRIKHGYYEKTQS